MRRWESDGRRIGGARPMTDTKREDEPVLRCPDCGTRVLGEDMEEFRNDILEEAAQAVERVSQKFRFDVYAAAIRELKT